MVMKLNKSQLVKISKQLDGALEALDLLFQYEGGAKLMDDSKIDFSAIVGLRDRVEEMAEKKSRKKEAMKKAVLKKWIYGICKLIKLGKKPLLFLLKIAFKKPFTELERSYKISADA